jgi:hypothetical protein
VPEVQRKAAELGGAHILIFSRHSHAERHQIQADLQMFFRFRWLDSAALTLIPHSMEEFIRRLSAILAEELLWHNIVRPIDVTSSLLLPECAFTAQAEVAGMWRAAKDYGSEDRIRAAQKGLRAFELAHKAQVPSHGRRWVDATGRVFDYGGARHGQHVPFPRNWKYSYGIPSGFHYDVTSLYERVFSIVDHSGINYEVRADAHINIDAHGYLRGKVSA